uniref:Uncharacterized protein n=1 Tax=Solanum lycopersicum TaxID=4081 RepID=A0A3Q7EZ94_SOLLC
GSYNSGISKRLLQKREIVENWKRLLASLKGEDQQQLQLHSQTPKPLLLVDCCMPLPLHFLHHHQQHRPPNHLLLHMDYCMPPPLHFLHHHHKH